MEIELAEHKRYWDISTRGIRIRVQRPRKLIDRLETNGNRVRGKIPPYH